MFNLQGDCDVGSRWVRVTHCVKDKVDAEDPLFKLKPYRKGRTKTSGGVSRLMRGYRYPDLLPSGGPMTNETSEGSSVGQALRDGQPE